LTENFLFKVQVGRPSFGSVLIPSGSGFGLKISHPLPHIFNSLLKKKKKKKMGFVICPVFWAIDSTIVKNKKLSLFAPVYIFVKCKSKENIIKISLYC
jgi:hypothetical protein